jgi:hypothetical protein
MQKHYTMLVLLTDIKKNATHISDNKDQSHDTVNKTVPRIIQGCDLSVS